MDEQARKILKEYTKSSPILLLIIMLVICSGAGGLQIWRAAASGITAMSVISVVPCLFAAAISAVRLFLFLRGRGDFMRECAALGEDALKEYESAKPLGNRWFSDNYLLFYGKYRPHIMKLSEIEAAEQKGSAVRVAYSGKTGVSPVALNENAAIILAALKSKNDKIKIIIKGEIVSADRKGR